MQELKIALSAAVKKLFDVDVPVVLTRPDEQFGDYASNVALQLAGQLGKNPREIAEQIAGELDDNALLAAKPEVAGPGFINMRLSDQQMIAAISAATDLAKPLAGQNIVAEYSDPNPFKVLHVGHLYTSVVGDAIANLLEAAGATVHRVNFGGDVGLHVGKTMWAIIKELGGEKPEMLEQVKDKPQWMADRYVEGNNAYEENDEAKPEILEINKRVYEIQANDEHDSTLAQIYWTTRRWSYEYFEKFYASIGSGFEKYYPESQTVNLGLETVKANIGKVFEESEGAVVFKGETHNLHTRVFINQRGLPTYETKDVGLILLKEKDYSFDRSIIITANDQLEYMQVVLKALEQIRPDLTSKTTHLTHGIVKLPGKQKMSSRKGNIISAEAVIVLAQIANRNINGQEDDRTALAAIKYAFLRQRLGGDVIYDPAESVSLEGNSGPYLQYAHARAMSILAKAGDGETGLVDLDSGERSLARKISEYPEVVAAATNDLLPSHIATYLYELAQAFNRFYEHNRVIDDERRVTRIALVRIYGGVLKHGLALLGIDAPDKM